MTAPQDRAATAVPPTAPVEVLVVSHGVQVWGAQLRLLDLAGPLAERGIRLRLASPPGSPVAEAWEGRGFPLQPLDLPEHKGLRGADGERPGARAVLAELLAVARSTARVARAARSADVLLSFSLHAHLEVALAGRLARRPVVVEVVDIVTPGLGRRLLQLASSLAEVTLTNSAATAGTLERRAERAAVIHPGVDLERFQPGPADPDVRDALGGAGRPLVGIVGRVDPRKGVGVLAEALALASGEGRRAGLAVVGDVAVSSEEDLAALRHRASDLLGERVRFVGRRPDVPAVLRALDVLVNASEAEPFGRSVLEAQASGTAVVGTAAGGIPEFVADGETGLLVPPGDPAALAAALDRLLDDDDLRSRLAGAARRQAEERFALSSRYDLVADVFRRAVGGRRRRGRW